MTFDETYTRLLQEAVENWNAVIDSDGYVIEIDDGEKTESIATKSFEELLVVIQDAKMNRMDRMWLNPAKLHSTYNDKTMVINGLSKKDLNGLKDHMLKHRVA
jgi:hypothetical protein